MPINHVSGKALPVLLIHGRSDTTVLPRNSANLAARIRAAGGQVQELTYADIDHIWLVGAIGAPLRSIAPTPNDVDAFLKKQPRSCAP